MRIEYYARKVDRDIDREYFYFTRQILFHANIQNNADTQGYKKKVTHKDYQTRQWPMHQPFPARTEKLERHIVLEKGFRKIQKTTCDFNIHFKNFSNLFIQNLPHGTLFIPFRKSVQNSQQLFPTISNQYRTCAYL